MEFSMRMILATVLVAVLTFLVGIRALPSWAQSKGLAGEMSKTQREPPRKKTDDKDYKSALERMPDQKYDPWRQMR
jgi:hypothetical protein